MMLVPLTVDEQDLPKRASRTNPAGGHTSDLINGYRLEGRSIRRPSLTTANDGGVDPRVCGGAWTAGAIQRAVGSGIPMASTLYKTTDPVEGVSNDPRRQARG
jgi:hypothetical protein